MDSNKMMIDCGGSGIWCQGSASATKIGIRAKRILPKFSPAVRRVRSMISRLGNRPPTCDDFAMDYDIGVVNHVDAPRPLVSRCRHQYRRQVSPQNRIGIARLPIIDLGDHNITRLAAFAFMRIYKHEIAWQVPLTFHRI